MPSVRLPYEPGTILRNTGGSGSYAAYRVIRRLPDDFYEVEVTELLPPGSDNAGRLTLDSRVVRERVHLDRFGYRPVDRFGYRPDTSPPSESREEVKMKIHTLIHNSPDEPTPVSAVTMPEATFGSPVATRYFDGDAWYHHSVPDLELTPDRSVLVEFSDGSLGVCAETELVDALDAFGLQLVTS